MNVSRFACLAVSFGLLTACAAESNDEPEANASEAELGVARLSEITVGRSTGFSPPPPPGSCRPSGRYTVDFNRKRLSGQGCIANAQVTVDRDLDGAELARVRAGVAAVKTARRPEACPTDGPVTSLSVKRNERTTFYVDAQSSCGTSLKPADEATLDTLLTTVEGLVKPSTQTFEGELASIFAIGGETTGKVLFTANGAFELELGAHAGEFVDGQKARVVGVRVDRPGVEIPVRHLITVTDLLVCPSASTVNCMPPTSTKVCLPENRRWIEESCAGVGFLD